MSEQILKAVQEHANATAGELKSLRDTQTELQNEIADLAQKQGGSHGMGAPAIKTLGGIIAKSEQLRLIQSGNAKNVVIPADVTIKALVGDAGGVGDDPYPVAPQRDTRVGEAPRRRLNLLDFLAPVQVNSNTFEFVALDGYANAADYQTTEGSEKPEQTLPTDLKSAPVVTIAAFLRASEQALADAPGLQQFIDAHMRHAIREKLEAEIIAGAGGTGQITGLLSQATAYTGDSTGPLADIIGAAMVTLEAAGWNPGVIVMNPANWHAIRSERAETGNGQYVTAGWQNPASPSIWGAPVVTSPTMPDGQALVMDPSQVAVLDRMAVRTEIGRAGDDFIQNVLTIRTEARSGLVLFSPSSCLLITQGSGE